MRTMLIAVAIAFCVGVAAMASGYYLWTGGWQARSVQPAPSHDTTAAAQTPEPLNPPSEDVATLNSLATREAVLANQMAALEQRLSNVDSNSRVASTFATRAEGLMVAFASRRAIDRGLPLTYLEGQLRERFAATQPRAVAIVITAAHNPVTLEDLRLALETIGPNLLRKEGARGWWSSVRRELSQLVIIRHSSTPDPRAGERLQRAKRMLDAGNVQGSLGEVMQMPGANEATSWIRAARRYILARKALDAIEATALEGPEVVQSPQPAPQNQSAPATGAPSATTDTTTNPQPQD
ncbi:hypothetical protein GCM10023219_18410 [Stakelama sediminis]|uniref:Inner membrane protein n=2 Tax=Stakelama sediminis TaxID=463200 RepID=A0A840Z226_9SPHN|nr:hypothetical protein [Stakelama sediminis]MBB5719849.1 hypothetical protein [Stakelama sediminis]